MNVYELEQQRTIADDGKNVRAISLFQVEGAADHEEALYAPGVPSAGNGLLSGDPHPTLPGVFADSKSVAERIGPDTFRVQVNYSDDRAFKFGERPPSVNPDTNRAYWYGDSRLRDIIFPTFVKTVTLAKDADGNAVEKLIWSRVEVKRTIMEQLLIVVVYVDDYTLADGQLIAAQFNTLHQFDNGQTYIFEGGFPKRLSDGVTEITFTWSRFGDANGRIYFAWDAPPADQIWPPYLPFTHEYRVIPPQSFDADPQITTIWRVDYLNSFEWRNLPGADRL